MKLPSMKFTDGITKNKQVKFSGLNHTYAAEDGELWDMKNLTSDHAPLLGTREPRRLYRKLESPGGLFCWDKLCWVDGTKFYYDGVEKGTVSAGQKTFAALLDKIVIFPDKCYYDRASDTFGSMEAKWEGTSLTFTNGTIYDEDAEANTIQVTGVDWSKYFTAGDCVSISGCSTYPGNNKSIVIRSIDGDKLVFYEYSFTLAGDGTENYTEKGQLTITRTVPNLKGVFEHENRLWGCTDRTVYATKQGDIFNWNVSDGIASDSWVTDTGSVGDFVGCVPFRGYATFFKESNIYKVYGTIPSNFQLMGSATLGLEETSAKSLAVAGETLFYLSRSGIMAYSGGIPQPVGEVFGQERFRNAVGGSDGLKYYVSMQGEDGMWRLYVYDTQRGLWHIEDDMHVTHFTMWDGNLYFLNDKGEIWIGGNVQEPPADSDAEPPFEWMAEFADFTEGDPNVKGIGKLQLRLELETGATAQVWIQYDSDGKWIPVRMLMGERTKRSHYLPVIPRRCDHYRIRITGTGGCRIFSLVRESYSGSEFKTNNRRHF